jgi:NTP pyrophosphatase (non-canonical NTP hydrolase)
MGKLFAAYGHLNEADTITTAEFEEFVNVAFTDNRQRENPDFHNARHLLISTMGLSGEVGEFLELLKKEVRNGEDAGRQIPMEAGDILYYLVILLHMKGWTLRDAMSAVIFKLGRREEFGKSHEEEVNGRW